MPDEIMPGVRDTHINVTIPDMHVTLDVTCVEVRVASNATGSKQLVVQRTSYPHKIEWLVTAGPDGVIFRDDSYDIALAYAMANLRRQIITEVAGHALQDYLDNIIGG